MQRLRDTNFMPSTILQRTLPERMRRAEDPSTELVRADPLHLSPLFTLATLLASDIHHCMSMTKFAAVEEIRSSLCQYFAPLHSSNGRSSSPLPGPLGPFPFDDLSFRRSSVWRYNGSQAVSAIQSIAICVPDRLASTNCRAAQMKQAATNPITSD